MEPNKHIPRRSSPPVEQGQPHTEIQPSPVTRESGPAATEPQHRRNGKIARLPHEDRELLNIMLRDGATYPRIIQKFAERGHKLNAKNVSRWHAGGHQDWLEDQAFLEELDQRLDFATKLVQKSSGAVLDTASMRIAVAQMYTLLMTFDPATLKEKLTTNPGAYSRILNSLCKLTEGSMRCERRMGTALHPPSSIPHPTGHVGKCR